MTNYRLWRWMMGRGTAVLLLWLAFALLVSSAVHKSATVDEQSHLFRGAAYLKTGATHFLLGHPLLGSSLSALPLLTEVNLQLPLDSPAWAAGNWSLAGDAFLWRLSANPQRLLLLGRLPVIWMTLLLGALVGRWGRQLAGHAAGLLAMALLLLDPNVLAHGRFITGDLPLTLFFLLTLYGFWRRVEGEEGGERGNRQSSIVNRQLLLAGVGLGLAGATKFNAALLLPVLGLVALVLAVRWRSVRPLHGLLVMGIVGWLVIWAVYRFTFWHGFLPGGAFWDDLFWELQYFGKPHGAYFAGEFSTAGWWYYFPVTFLLKTPLPSLLLLAAGFVWGACRWRSLSPNAVFLLLPPLIYLGFSLTSSLNIGYRYLLPLLPFLYLATAVSLTHFSATFRYGRYVVGGALAALLGVTLLAWPDYVPFFNLFAEGNGWRILSDSNVDWGQDLPALAAWQQNTGTPLYLSYFGTAHPSAYGLDFVALPTWEPGAEQTLFTRQTFNPADPAPGFYAISVTNLHGIVLGEQRDAFAWFRDREPLARIGGSIFVYEVAARGTPVNVAFSDLRPADMASELHDAWATNDVRVRWFDARTSLVWPAGGGWWALPTEQQVDALLLPYVRATAEMRSNDGAQRLLRPAFPPVLPWVENASVGETAVFLGYDDVHNDGPANEITLITGWQVAQVTERPLKIFVHALDETGQIVGQWDGLDVDPTTWQPGDVFVQLHRFVVPETAVIHAFAIGLYDGETLERLLEPIQVASGEG